MKKRIMRKKARKVRSPRDRGRWADWCLLFALLPAALGQWLLNGRQLGFGLALFGLAAALLACGLYFSPRKEGEVGEVSPPRFLEWGILGGLVVLAVFFRVYKLGELPTGCFFDEAQNGIEAQRILRGEGYPVYIERLTQLPALYMYFLAASLKAFGASVLSVRLVSVLSGVIAVPLFYLLARRLFSPLLALTLAGFLAVSRWHINFSRVGFVGVQTILFSIPAVYFLLKALQEGRRRDYVLAGLFLGLGLHSYIASRLLLLVFLCFFLFLYWYLYGRDRGWIISLAALPVLLAVMFSVPPLMFYAYYAYLFCFVWLLPRFAPDLRRHLHWLLIASVIIALPLHAYWLAYPEHLGSRTATTSVMREVIQAGSIHPLWDNIKKHLLMFNYIGDSNGRHNVPAVPMLEYFGGLLMALGVFVSLLRPRRLESVLLLLWFAGMVSGGVLSLNFEAPQGYRSLGAIPAVILLAGVYPQLLIDRFGRWDGRGQARATTALVVFFVLVLGVAVDGWQAYHRYFHLGPRDGSVWASFSTVESIIGRDLKKAKHNERYYFSPRYMGHPTIRFVSGGWDDYREFYFHRNIPVAEDIAAPQAFFLQLEQKHRLEFMRQLYPSAEFSEIHDPFHHTVLIKGKIRPGDLPAARGLTASYYDSTGRFLVKRRERWPELGGYPGAARAVWRGLLYAKNSGGYRLEVAGVGGFTLRIDERIRTAGQTIDLAAGFHGFSLEAGAGAAGALRPRVTVQGIKDPFFASDYYGGLTRKSNFPWGSRLWNHIFNSAFDESLVKRYRRQGGLAPWADEVDPVLIFQGAFYPFRFFTPGPQAEWRGSLRAPREGAYILGLKGDGICELWLGEQRLVLTRGPGQNGEARIYLGKGRYPITVIYRKQDGWAGLLEFYWHAPERDREIVPQAFLIPE